MQLQARDLQKRETEVGCEIARKVPRQPQAGRPATPACRMQEDSAQRKVISSGVPRSSPLPELVSPSNGGTWRTSGRAGGDANTGATDL